MKNIGRTVVLGIACMAMLLSGCNKDEAWVCGEPFIDARDGNTYKTVQIGNQCWMAENLRSTSYQNGDPVTSILSDLSWENTTDGAWSHVEGNGANEATYGKLYNWYAASDPREICPKGWFLPSDNQWSILVNFLGGETEAGGKLKEASTMYWDAPNTGATNSTGFTALPTGNREYNGFYYAPGANAYYWSNSESDVAKGLLRGLRYVNPFILRVAADKNVGVGCRCVKD